MSTHPATTALQAVHDDVSRRVAIHAAVGNLADQLIQGDDLRAHHDEHERLCHLTAAVGDVAVDIISNGACDLEAALLRLAAEAQLWLESSAREAAR